jgi:hypothetical protein
LEEENKIIKKQMEQSGLENDNKIKLIKLENNIKIKKLTKVNNDLKKVIKKQGQSTLHQTSTMAR